MYTGISFGLSTLVRLVRLCSMHVCIGTLSTVILFGLSTGMFYVCWYFIQSSGSMYVGIFFGLSTLVCWYFIES